MTGRSGRLTPSVLGPESLGISSAGAFPFGGRARARLSPDSQSTPQSFCLRVSGVVAPSAPGVARMRVRPGLSCGVLQLSLVRQPRLRAAGVGSGRECVMGSAVQQVGPYPRQPQKRGGVSSFRSTPLRPSANAPLSRNTSRLAAWS